MAEKNTVAFKYNPVDGSLYLDGFRVQFYTERLDDIKDTLQYLQFAFRFVREIEGEIEFIDRPDIAPRILGLRYSSHQDRASRGEPCPDTEVTLWPA